MTVAIVLDPAYSELERLAEQMPIWAVDSALHRGVAERLWQKRGMADAFQGITLFKVLDERDAEVNCANIIGEVDLHHGIYSSGSRVASLKVIGATQSNKLLEALGASGFVRFETTPDGFLAHAE
ncbi:MAG TPA: hypothetical protein VJW96_08380 [Terriglobales bacterium]|jgi:hypothetical protein|nr:hypothetical protein [Terriglobales bacterium]